MSDGGSVLPQAEIDALFKQATGMSISPPSSPNKTKVSDGPASPSANPAPPVAQPPPQPETPLVNSPSPPPPPSAPVTPTPPMPAASPPPMPPPLLDIQVTLDDLVGRLSKIEASINQLYRKAREEPDISVPIKKISQKVTALSKNLQKVNGRVNIIQKGLDGTAAYGVHNDFSCTSCGSQGTVALPMKCTKCGEEGWLGWWPKDK